jgi:hypothetical protein
LTAFIAFEVLEEIDVRKPTKINSQAKRKSTAVLHVQHYANADIFFLIGHFHVRIFARAANLMREFITFLGTLEQTSENPNYV